MTRRGQHAVAAARVAACVAACVAVVATGVGCSRDEPRVVDAGAKATAEGVVDASAAGATAPGENGGRAGGNGGVGAGAGGRAKRQAPPFVYVDGQPWAALQVAELPPGLKPTVDGGESGEVGRRYSLLAYLRAVGVDVKKIREVHLHGGRTRIGVLTGAQLRAPPDTEFSFTRATGGRAVMRWAPNAVATDMIDKVNDVAVYIDKPPPVRDPNTGALTVDGVPIEGPAYVTADVQGGTRAYVDGRLVGILRPRDLDGDGPHPVLAQLARLGADATGVVAVDLIHDDVLVRRVPAGEIASLSFTMPPGAGGVTAFGNDTASVVRAWRKKAPALRP
jgi:hypothetical protein